MAPQQSPAPPQPSSFTSPLTLQSNSNNNIGSRIPTSANSTSSGNRPRRYHCLGRERRLTVDLGLAAMLNNNNHNSNSFGLCSSPSLLHTPNPFGGTNSRCHTPTTTTGSSSGGIITGATTTMMNGSITSTLPREHRPMPSPKCFGKNTHILKEDYERERQRWEKKLEEVELKLTEAAVHNSELFQLKAELNRKIIDFEKSQRPLIEQNRRLGDRVKAANLEARKLEETLSHVQDELLSLRDQYERVLKENAALREQRAFPEKLEELGRYRAQVLEMSKCITALRQSAAEKDRRHELLILKLKRMRRAAAAAQESDRQSCAAGSEGSVEDSGSLGTITEDLDEDVELLSTTDMLIGGRGVHAAAEYVLLRQQLDMANEQLASMQRDMERAQARVEGADRLSASMSKLRSDLNSAWERERKQEQQLASVQSQNEALEFELSELLAGTQGGKPQPKNAGEFADKICATDVSLPAEPEELIEMEELNEQFNDMLVVGKKRHSVSAEWLNELRARMREAVQNNCSSLLSGRQRQAIRSGMDAIECLQNQYTFVQTELNMANCENSRLQRELEQRELDWKSRLAEAQDERQQRKRELKAELEQQRKERRDEAARFARQVEQLSGALNEKIHAMADLTDRVGQLGAELDICRCQLAAGQAESAALREQLAELGRDREREVGRLAMELREAEESRERMANKGAEDVEQMRTEFARVQREWDADKVQLEQVRTYNRELESQFNTQMDLFGALKRKLLSLQQQQSSTPPPALTVGINGNGGGNSGSPMNSNNNSNQNNQRHGNTGCTSPLRNTNANKVDSSSSSSNGCSAASPSSAFPGSFELLSTATANGRNEHHPRKFENGNGNGIYRNGIWQQQQQPQQHPMSINKKDNC